jgi:hypothetical protein
MSDEEFYCKKINNKLIQHPQDPLFLASRSLPEWCKNLVHSYKFLFPFETRQVYFLTTSFGMSRSIVWLQNKRDSVLANSRGPTSQRAWSCFNLCGIFIEKSLQDQRLVDMPFSMSFLKVLCLYSEDAGSERDEDDDLNVEVEINEMKILTKPANNLDEILNINNLFLVDPHRASLLKKMQGIVE